MMSTIVPSPSSATAARTASPRPSNNPRTSSTGMHGKTRRIVAWMAMTMMMMIGVLGWAPTAAAVATAAAPFAGRSSSDPASLKPRRVLIGPLSGDSCCRPLPQRNGGRGGGGTTLSSSSSSSSKSKAVRVALVATSESYDPLLRSRLSSNGPNKFTYTGITSQRSAVAGSSTDDVLEEQDASVRPLLAEVKKSLKRASWLSWWAQVILTTISSVILLFARNVLLQQQPSMSFAAPKLFLSTSGIVASALSIIWTWGNGQRLSRRIVKPNTSAIRAAMLLRRAIKVGCLLNLAGLLLHLLAAEQIVGSLAIKVLTLPRSPSTYLLGGVGTAALEGALQPLDILIVQANTNSLLSHFCSLVLLLSLVDPLHRLDPPSTTESRRGQLPPSP